MIFQILQMVSLSYQYYIPYNVKLTKKNGEDRQEKIPKVKFHLSYRFY